MHRDSIVPAQADFLTGGGEMGELIRKMDWSENILGEPAQWSKSLQTSVSICLNSRFPMQVWWGNDLVKIYNDAYSKLIGAKHPKAMGSRGADVWPEIWPVVGPMLQSVLDTGKATWSEDQLLINERNGYPEECYFTFSYSAIRDESGAVGGVFCAVNETTQKVLSEKKLVKQFSDLFVKAPVAICILRGENYVIEVINERMAEMWDRKLEAVINKPVFDVLAELKEQGFKELLDTVYYKGERFVTEELPVNFIRNGKSDNAFLKFVYEPLREEDGSVSGVMALAHEITEEVNSRKKIEESEAFNRTVLESSPDCLKVIDGEGRLVFMNGNGLCTLEIDDFTSIENKAWWDIWSANNKAMVKAAVAKALRGEQAYFQAKDYTFKGTLKWWDVIVSPVLDEKSAKVSNIIAVSRDITLQKQEAINLQESEHRYSNFIHSSSSLILILKSEDLLIEVANTAMLQNLGKGKEIIGKPLLEVLPGLNENDLGMLLHKVYETGEPYYGYEFPVHISRNGIRELSYYTFVLQAQKNLDGLIEGLAVIANEVTPQATLNLAVKESEERFRSLADNIPMFTYIIEPDEEANVSYWNKTWLDYTGQTETEALGRGWHGIIHPDDIPGVMEIYLYALKKRIPYYLPAVRVKRFDGKYRWHMIKSNPRYMPDGTFMGFIGVGFDIHESKLATTALKESERHLRMMSDLMPAKITNTDVAGNVTYYNKNWLDFTGRDFEELKNLGYHKIIHPDDLEEYENRFRQASATGTNLEMEMRLMNTEGEYIWHLNLASPVKDETGKINMWIGVTTEIQKIKEEERLKNNFLSMASHELKTPLTTVKAYGQIAARMLQHKADIETLGIVNRMGKQIDKLNNLFSDLLDFTKLKRGKLIYHEAFFNFNELVQEIIEDMQSTSTTHIIESSFGQNATIYGDKDKLGQVLNNLISNAIKYSPNAAKIIISSVSEEAGVKLMVRDFGIGILPDEEQKVFEEFYRVSGDNQSTYPGMGIGLYISTEIVKNFNGRLWVESTGDAGSVFSLFIPFDYRELTATEN